MRRTKRNQTRRQPTAGRLHALTSEGSRATCRDCNSTEQVDHPEYKGRCLRCDGTGQVVLAK